MEDRAYVNTQRSIHFILFRNTIEIVLFFFSFWCVCVLNIFCQKKKEWKTWKLFYFPILLVCITEKHEQIRVSKSCLSLTFFFELRILLKVFVLKCGYLMGIKYGNGFFSCRSKINCLFSILWFLQITFQSRYCNLIANKVFIFMQNLLKKMTNENVIRIFHHFEN